MFSQQGKERQTFLDNKISGHLIPRPRKAEEVANGILFTLENEFITRTVVDVDGGAISS